MKSLFIYLAIVLAISFYIWINIIKEGNQDTDITTINNLLTSHYEKTSGKNYNGNQATTERDVSTNILKSNKVSSGITSIDRYNDPMCSPSKNGQSYIYCVDGQIECQDIFGEKMNYLQGMGQYDMGTTLGGCGSYIDKTDLADYTKEIGKDLVRGVYFDLSNCTNKEPWRVGGNKIKQKSDVIPFQGCYKSQSDADNAWDKIIDLSLNTYAEYKVNDPIFILANFLNSQNLQGFPQILAPLDKDKTSFTRKNNQKYYYGSIYAVTGDTYTVTIKNIPNTIQVSNVPKSALLKDSLYNPKTNSYFSDLKTGSHARPVCKSGAFTSCLSSPPFIMKNGSYISTKDPLLTAYADGTSPTIKSQNQFNNGTIPFSTAPVNPSGIIDNPPNSLLEYNYFAKNSDETPFIKCIADYGSNIGDPLCCNQTGTVTNTKYICPQEVPKCSGYSVNDNTYGYCN